MDKEDQFETISPKVTLDDITAFLSKQEDQSASLEERTDYAITLLQSLPCARYAVLEKIGEVFFEEAKHYIIEKERQHLSGLPSFNHFSSTKQAVQIKKIQNVLVLSIQANSKAWAPMIFQWSIQTLSQICGEYGNKRHFSSLTLHDRFKLWLECSATKVLLEIIITCLHKIIHKNQETCLKKLLAATLSCSPFFDWAFSHICFIFKDVLPYNLLYHALDAFSNQSRRVEMIIKTMINVYKCIYPKNNEVITNAILQLFKESFVDIKDEKIESNHITLCVVPFLLHISTKSIEFFLPLIDKIIQFLTYDHLVILSKQSLEREGVLQRGLLRRVVDCIKMIDRSSYNLLQFIFKYAFNEDKDMINLNSPLATSMQSTCYNILDFLMLHLKTDVNVYSHQHLYPSSKEELIMKVPFLTSLATYWKQLCNLMINAIGPKKEKLQNILIFLGLQEGKEKMINILSFILINNKNKLQSSHIDFFISQYQLQEKCILKCVFDSIFSNVPIFEKYTRSQIKNFLETLKVCIDNEIENLQLDFSGQVRNYVKEISQILLVTDENDELALVTMKVLNLLCASDLRVSEYAVLVKAVLCYYFNIMDKLKTSDESTTKELAVYFRECDHLLITVINKYKGTQQLVVRILLDSIIKDKVKINDTEPEESLIKIELLQKNYLFDRKARFSNSATSINYRDGLNLNKRKHQEIHEYNDQLMTQYFIITITNVLSISSSFNTASKMEVDKNSNFMSVWSEKAFSRIFPSAYASMAAFLSELVCPDVIAVTSWPDEDFLKYTIERDLKVKNIFNSYKVLWNMLEIISIARPSLYHCSIIIQSLLGMSLKFWQTNRAQSVFIKSDEVKKISCLLSILKLAGWLPYEFDTISDVFHLIKPKEIYEILSAIWKYLKLQDFAPDKFIDRDQLGRPQLPTNHEHVQNVQSVIKIIFLRNISCLGQYYHRYLKFFVNYFL